MGLRADRDSGAEAKPRQGCLCLCFIQSASLPGCDLWLLVALRQEGGGSADGLPLLASRAEGQ